MADELLDLVPTGRKRATCWSAEVGIQDAFIGGQWVVEDSKGRARAIVETTSLEKVVFEKVDAEFAAAEGEGDLTLEYWRNAHQKFFEKHGGFDSQMLLWCENFELVEVLALEEET